MKKVIRKNTSKTKIFLLIVLMLFLPLIFGNTVSFAISADLDDAIQVLLDRVVERESRTMVLTKEEYSAIVVNKKGNPLKGALTYEQYEQLFTESKFIFKTDMDPNRYNSIQSVLEDALKSAIGPEMSEKELIEMLNPPEGSIYSFDGVPSLFEEIVKTFATSIDWQNGLAINGTFYWYKWPGGYRNEELAEIFNVVKQQAEAIQTEIKEKEEKILRKLRRAIRDERQALQDLYNSLSQDQGLPVSEPDWVALGYDKDLRGLSFGDLDAILTALENKNSEMVEEAKEVVGDTIVDIETARSDLQNLYDDLSVTQASP